MQPPPRRHDGSYAPMPAHMRSHPGYQPYYPQQMGPMMPQYPQHYAPNWYPYQQQHMHPVQQRPHYYPQSPMPPPQYPQHHGATVSPNQHIQPQPSPRLVQTSSAQQPPPSSTSTTSPAPVQTPPSPPLSTSTAVSARKEASPRSESPAQQRVQTPSIELPAETERFTPPVSSTVHVVAAAANISRFHGFPSKEAHFPSGQLGRDDEYSDRSWQTSRSPTRSQSLQKTPHPMS